MNKLTIIGNVGNSPELRTTPNGIAVCTFSVAVNGKKREDPVQWFRVTVWRQLGENCARYLSKGKKVAVVGPVSVSTYENKAGKTIASLEVTADDVEFLSPREGADSGVNNYTPQGFTPVDASEDLPF